MSQIPDVSVIIPSYNYGHLIKRCIDSILSQTYENFEIIIVDNYSSDNTEQVISSIKDNRINFIQINNNGCIAKSRNVGIKYSRGKYIAFCDADDWWDSNKLEECMELFDNYDMVYHKLKIQNSIGSKSKIVGRSPHSSLSKDILLNGNFINQSSVIVKKEWLEKINYIDEDINIVGVEDCDTWIRLDLIGCKIGYVNKSLGYLWVGNSFSASRKQIKKEETLLNRYMHLLTEKEKLRGISTLNLREGRIYHILGDFECAKNKYYKSLNTSNITRIIKVIILLILASIRYKR